MKTVKIKGWKNKTGIKDLANFLEIHTLSTLNGI